MLSTWVLKGTSIVVVLLKNCIARTNMQCTKILRNEKEKSLGCQSRRGSRCLGWRSLSKENGEDRRELRIGNMRAGWQSCL